MFYIIASNPKNIPFESPMLHGSLRNDSAGFFLFLEEHLVGDA